MIPSKIHYCWFGRNPKSELVQKCINSWQKYCPDYEIIEWNEDNIDLDACPLYVREAYVRKKWAFVTDYVRLKVVYENGGFYLDTDVELLRPLNCMSKHRAYLGSEGADYVNTGLGFGAEAGFPFLRANMTVYEELNPINENGEFVSNPCPHYTTRLLKEAGVVFPIVRTYETADGLVIYPNHFFNPYNWKTQELCVNKETISIHHYSGSWMTEAQRKGYLQRAKSEQIERKFGSFAAKLYEIYFWNKKENGGAGLVKWFFKKLGGR